MNTSEDRLAAALAIRAARAEPRADLAAVADGAVIGVGVRATRRRWLPIVAVAAAIAAIAVSGIVLARGGGDDAPRWGEPGPAQPPVEPAIVAGGESALSWVTPHAALAAHSIAIEYPGLTLSPPPDAVAESSLLSRSEELVRVTWSEQDVQVEWELLLTLRDDEWWVDEMNVLTQRTSLQGSPGTSAVHLDDDSARLPLGTALTGDLDLSGTEGGISVRVRVTGLWLLGFRDRAAGGGSAPVETAPPPVLVAAPERPADVRPTGMYSSAEEWMVVLAAQDALTRECMSAAGFDYPRIPDDVLVQQMGQWSVTAGVSVHGRVAAAATGYHTVDAGILNGGAHGLPGTLPAAQQEEFLAALGGGGDGCLDDTDAVIGDRQANSPMAAWNVIVASGQEISEVRDQAFHDPEVIAALDAWGACMVAAVGERAANPNELARMYAFASGDPAQGEATDHEKAVAVADRDCQRAVDYETIWYTAVVARERVAIGARVADYDQWVRDYQAMVGRAEQVLADRGIVLPPLD